MLCSHGCGNEGKFFSENTKNWRCSNHVNRCPAKAAKTGKAIKSAFSKIDYITGKTINELRLEKIRLTRKTKIDIKTGLPLDVARAYNAHKTKQTITISGRTIQEESSIKISNTKKGNPITKLAGIKANKTMKKSIDPITGLTKKELAVQKRLVTMSRIEDNGLTFMENSLIKSKFRGFKINYFKNFKIYYQGNNELDFLNSQFEIYGDSLFDHVKRAPSIWYFDPTRSQNRLYFPDFIIDDIIIIEIKSKWTWNNNVENSIIHKRNIAKLDAVSAAGYSVRLILDGINIIWPQSIHPSP
jgi:hypothetical protein